MAVFGEDIKELTDIEKPLAHNCQTYYGCNEKTSTIKTLEDSHYYTQIKYPISSFKSFYDLDIDFDPFNERKYCYFETEHDYTKNNCTYIRPFIVTLPHDSSRFDVVKDVEMLKGIAFIGANRTEHLSALKKICDQPENFIEQVNNGEIQSSRYMPKVDDMIEQMDDDELKEKLIDCYKIIFDDVDLAKVLRYERMIDNNIKHINERIIKPIFMKVLCSSHDLFGDVFMKTGADVEKQSEYIKSKLELREKNLLLVDCIESFNKFISTYIDKEAFIDEKVHGKVGSLVPSHNLALWELIKYVHSIFKDIYITLKTVDTQQYNQFKVNMMDSDIDDDDDEYNLGDFFDLMTSSSIGFSNKKKNIKKDRFIPSPYNDFKEFDTEMVPVYQEKLYVDIEKMNDIERNSMLGHTHIPMDYEEYIKLLPESSYQPLITPTRHY